MIVRPVDYKSHWVVNQFHRHPLALCRFCHYVSTADTGLCTSTGRPFSHRKWREPSFLKSALNKIRPVLRVQLKLYEQFALMTCYLKVDQQFVCFITVFKISAVAKMHKPKSLSPSKGNGERYKLHNYKISNSLSFRKFIQQMNCADFRWPAWRWPTWLLHYKWKAY